MTPVRYLPDDAYAGLKAVDNLYVEANEGWVSIGPMVMRRDVDAVDGEVVSFLLRLVPDVDVPRPNTRFEVTIKRLSETDEATEDRRES